MLTIERLIWKNTYPYTKKDVQNNKCEEDDANSQTTDKRKWVAAFAKGILRLPISLCAMCIFSKQSQIPLLTAWWSLVGEVTAYKPGVFHISKQYIVHELKQTAIHCRWVKKNVFREFTILRSTMKACKQTHWSHLPPARLPPAAPEPNSRQWLQSVPDYITRH